MKIKMNLFKLFNKQIVVSTLLSCFFSFVNCSALEVTDLLGYPVYKCDKKVVYRYSKKDVGSFSEILPLFNIDQIESETFQIKACNSEDLFVLRKSCCDEYGDELWEISSQDGFLYGLLNVKKYLSKTFLINIELQVNDKKEILDYSIDTGRLRLLDKQGKQKLVLCSELNSDPLSFHLVAILLDQILV